MFNNRLPVNDENLAELMTARFSVILALLLSDRGRIQTCNLLSRNQMRYSVAPRGLI